MAKVTKPHLVRGIDPIPEFWESASGWRALQGLSRSRTVLRRLIAGSDDRNIARALRGVLTRVENARNHISGGFVTKDIAPLAAKIARLDAKAKRHIARMKAREARP